jgi:hypothetical protein
MKVTQFCKNPENMALFVASQHLSFNLKIGRWSKSRGTKVDVAIKQIDFKFGSTKMMDFMETCVSR